MRDAPMPVKLLALVLLCATCGTGVVWLISKSAGLWLFATLVAADILVLGVYSMIRRRGNHGGSHV